MRTHGVRDHPLYGTWSLMIRRCHNEGDKQYARYGGRGITVCPEWHDVAVFVAWIDQNLGARPEGHSLDRIDNNDGYRPGNVRWATASQQNSNRNKYSKRKNAA